MKNYNFLGYGNDTVEIPLLDKFMAEFVSLCERYGIGFENEAIGEGYGVLFPVAFKDADFDMFTENLDYYRGGIPWIDDAKAVYVKRMQEAEAERQALEKFNRQKRERAEYERLKARFEGTTPPPDTRTP